MELPKGYNDAPVKTMGNIAPRPNAYVFGIVRASVEYSRNNKRMLVLTLDIAEGKFKNYYRELTARFGDGKERYLKFYRLVDEEKSLPYFKGDIRAIEESNPGYQFTGDEHSLVRKYVGGMLRDEEYYRQDGSVGVTTKVAFLCSKETAMSGDLRVMPIKRVQASGRPYVPGEDEGEVPSQEQNPFEPQDKDLPF